jgi:trk system potassium uptake protein TrkA
VGVSVYYIIVGGGKIGYYLAKELLEDQHEVLIIEQDAEKCAQIADDLGEVVMLGDGCEAATLERAGMARADMVIALTGDDEDNLVACQVAKHKFDVPHTVARINNPKNESIFKKLGIDATISSTSVILAHIEQELPSHPLIPLMTLKGGLEIVEVKIPPEAQVVGRPIKGILLPQQSLITLIVGSDGQARLPTGDTIIQAGDEVVAVTMLENEEGLRSALTGTSVPPRS